MLQYLEVKLNKQTQILLQRITVDPGIMVGKPIIKGLRITVEQKALAGVLITTY